MFGTVGNQLKRISCCFSLSPLSLSPHLCSLMWRATIVPWIIHWHAWQQCPCVCLSVCSVYMFTMEGEQMQKAWQENNLPSLVCRDDETPLLHSLSPSIFIIFTLPSSSPSLPPSLSLSLSLSLSVCLSLFQSLCPWVSAASCVFGPLVPPHPPPTPLSIHFPHHWFLQQTLPPPPSCSYSSSSSSSIRTPLSLWPLGLHCHSNCW